MTYRFLALSVALAALVAGPAAAEEALGHVRSVTGEATAQRPGEAPRPLACGDPLYAGDTVRTAPGASVGIQSGDVATELAADSRLHLQRTDDGLPSVALEKGKVRMLDPRESGAPAHLAALDAGADVMGNDAEAYVFVEKVGPYAMLCEWDADLPVARGDDLHVAHPGECVISKPTEPLYTAKAHEARIPVTVAQACEIDPDAIASLAGAPGLHLAPGHVAAPPPVAGIGTAGLGLGNPQGSALTPRSPCDSPGAGCALPLPVVPREPPPVTGLPAPGAGGGTL